MTSVAAEQPRPRRSVRNQNPMDREDLSFDERISDRLNPVLVREIQQAMNGKVIMVTTMVAAIAIIFIGLPVLSAGQSNLSNHGRDAFLLVWQCLAPILLFVIPMRTFMSMREEVSGSTCEQLLLSNLRPFRIVSGKLASSLILATLFMSLFGPLLAVSYTMRGVDLPTILTSFVFAFVLTLGLTAAGAALGAICRYKGLQTLPVGVAAIGAGSLTVSMMAEMHWIVRDLEHTVRSSDLTDVLAATVVLSTLGILLFWMCASSVLTHPYENRSTPFRVLCLSAVLLIGVTFAVIEGGRGGGFIRIMPALAAVGCVALSPFWIFAVTDLEELSPRVRNFVPKSQLLALVAAPFYPGRGRGLLFVLLFCGLTLFCGLVLGNLMHSVSPRPDDLRGLFSCVFYVLLFAGIGAGIRGLFGNNMRAAWIARFSVPLAVLVCSVAPFLVTILLRGRPDGDWNMLHILNPFWTVNMIWRFNHEAFIIVGCLALLVWLPLLPTLARGIREMMVVSAERRRGTMSHPDDAAEQPAEQAAQQAEAEDVDAPPGSLEEQPS